MSLALTVGVLTEPNSALLYQREPAPEYRAEEFAEVEVAVLHTIGVDWSERRLPWGQSPVRWQLTTEECVTALSALSNRFSCDGDFCDYAEAVYTALCYGSMVVRLSRPRYDDAPYGYAVPVELRGFAHNNYYGEVGQFRDAFVVSSKQMAEECERLGALLELPTQLEPEVIRATTLEHPQGEGPTEWRRYGVESVVCATLLSAARSSVRTGCAIVFT